MVMDIVTGYKNDEKLRKSFTDLTRRVFGIDLDRWYENGFWQDDYIPYSAKEDGRIVANVSVNVCNLRWKGRVRHLAQLGTVVCDPGMRGRGYTGELMKRAVSECERSFEGVYLYADEEMTGFYEKYGFRRKYEWQCSKSVNITNTANLEKIPMDQPEERARLVDIIQRRENYGEKVMVNNPGLYMFYLTDRMKDSVWYLPDCDAYAVADVCGSDLRLHAVFSNDKVSLGEVISSFGSNIDHITMTFTPANNTGFIQTRIDEAGECLFVRGPIFDNVTNERFMFPLITRA